MRRLARHGGAVLLVLTALAAEARAEEPRALGEEDTRGAGGLTVQTRIGVATAPFGSTPFARAGAQVASGVVSVYGATGQSTWLGVRVPFVGASVRQPAGSYADAAAWGNPQVFGEAHGDGGTVAGRPVRVLGRLSIGLPLRPDETPGALEESRARVAANAASGWRTPGLFVPGVTSISPSLRLALEGRRWTLSGAVWASLLVGEQEGERGSRGSLGVWTGGEVQVVWWARPGLGLAAAGLLSVEAVRAIAPTQPAGHGQLTAAPRVLWQASRHLLLVLEGMVPLGGPLGGATGSLGLHAALAF